MTRFFEGKAAILAGLMMMSAGAASAAPANLVATDRTNPPIGHYEFCRTHAQECRPLGRDTGPMQLTRKAWSAMLEVNSDVNRAIVPDTDENIYGVPELWAYPRTVGDCEDFVLLKRQRLIERGFSPANLLITVVLQPNGEGHAVLTVRTDYGDYVLDNMRGDVRRWSETGYTFIKRQSSEHAGRWTKLGPGTATTAVGTVR